MPLPIGRRNAALAGAALLGLLAAVLFAVALGRPAGSPGESLGLARAALARRDYRAAEEAARRIERDGPVWVQSRLVAGEAATRLRRFEAAAGYYAEVPRDGSEAAVAAAFALGEVRRELGRLTEAEEAYRYVLSRRPGHAAARERMAFLLGVTGRRWESLPHFLSRLRSGDWTPEELVLVGDLERPMEQAEFLAGCLRKSPGDPAVKLGLAADAAGAGRAAEAKRLLAEVVAGGDLAAAHALLGEFLVDSDDDEFAAWHERVPRAGDGEPDVWYVRGLRARRLGELRVAARCFWETVRLAPAHRRGHVQLGQVLGSTGGDPEAAAAFTRKAALLAELTRTLDDVLRSKWRDEAAVRRAAELTEATGRLWEARAWAAVGSQAFPGSAWPRELFARVARSLPPDAGQTVPSADLARRFDLSGYPDHRGLFDGRRTGDAPRAAVAASPIRFEDEAAAAGIDFAYFNGADPATRGARVFEQNGGGVAATDFDLDGWPDLYFTQGADWPTGSKAPAPSPDKPDRLYRNLAGVAADVTPAAGVGDPGFGQGCAAGDFDGDGFPDLYVANVGRNRLYRNNGDATFADATAAAGIEGETWTASCVVVDLNADGHPDLFDATYLTGPDVYEAICDGHACSPKGFEGAPDRLWISRGDGTFVRAPDPGPAAGSKGLGVVAADLHRRGRPDLFVANDQVANFLLRNVPAGDPYGVDLVDEAFASGVAYNEDGLAMASMGVAADDADGNGRLDFFVTTFKDEPRLLFLQDGPGLFVDGTNPAGLRGASWPYVGWGTQFLDADRDGEPDLVAVNGHVDDYRDEGGAYHMRPQFFRNTGGARFLELGPEQAGAYFGREALGRGLARLDWNRDGLMDFAVSNIGDRASLVTGRSVDPGRFVGVRLHATRTARDAIGAVVSAAAGGRRWSKQLTAGDGYMASNERLLHFGLGPADRVDELRVAWPSGDVTVVRDLPTDVTVELTEGAGRATLWRGTAPTPLSVPPTSAAEPAAP